MAIVLVIGIPGAGKTTLCEHLMRSSLKNHRCYRFSFDEIFDEDHLLDYYWHQPNTSPKNENHQQTIENGSKLALLYGTNTQSTAHSERKYCERKVRNFLQDHYGHCGHDSPTSGESVPQEGIFKSDDSNLESEELSVNSEELPEELRDPPCSGPVWSKGGRKKTPLLLIDDIFYLRSMRRPFERMARAYGFQYLIVFVDTPLETAIARNRRRPNESRLADYQIVNVSQKLELPNEDDPNFIRHHQNESLQSLIEQIETKLIDGRSKIRPRRPHPSTGRSSNACSEGRNLGGNTGGSYWEQLDLELRKLIGELMSGQNADANLAKKFAMAKKELLNELRKQPQLKGIPSLEKLKEMLRNKMKQCKCKNDF